MPRRRFQLKSLASLRGTLPARWMPRVKSLLALLLWTAYVVVPAATWGFLHGVPVGLTGAMLLFVIWWTWWLNGKLPWPNVVAALVVLKLLAGALSVERGLEADYFGNPEWVPPVQRSTEFRSASFTRIDRRLAFSTGDAPDFPLFFFAAPDRARLPFSVTWQGYMEAKSGDDRQKFYLRGKGLTAELWVDGAQTVRKDPS